MVVGWVRRGALWASLGLVVAGLLVGCGSTNAGKECSSNSDCRGDLVCRNGACGFPNDPGGPDADGGACFVHDGRCVREVCDGGDGCRKVTCTRKCETWQELDGCTCVRRSCNRPEDCFGYACVDGQCRRCQSDDDCKGDKNCHSSGRCFSGKPCGDDSDCPARKQCSDRGECIDREDCLTNDDCDEDEICFNGQCTYSPECESDSDCRDGMECVGEQCYEEVCRGPDDCSGDKVCSAGECVEPPKASRCFVATPDQKIAKNARVRLKAYAVDKNGDGVPASFNWNSSKPSVAKIGSSGDFAVGGSSAGTAAITATLADGSGTKCKGKVELRNLGSVPSGKLRVVVTSAKSSKAVSGADVVIHGAGSSGTATTNNAGVARVAKPSGSYTVSVFHKDFNYLTVRGLQSTDIRLPLTEKEGSGPVGGFTGQFDKSKLHTSGDVTLGLAGSSISGGLLQVDLDQLLGRPVVRSVQTPMGSQDIPLPSGVVLNGKVAGFTFNIKDTYFTTSPGGARIGWGLAGEVSGSRLFQEFQGGIDNPLATLLPLFNRFDHAAKPLQLNAIARVTDSRDFDGDGDTSEKIPDYQSFPKVGLQPAVRQNLVSAVTVSNFPKLPGGDAEFAILVGGNLQNSAGMVPLGISATTDDDGDGFPDQRNLSMAPPHGAITSGRFVVMALAFRTDGLDPTQGLDLPNNLSAALWTRQSLPTKVGLGTFPNATNGSIDRAARTVRLDADAGPLFRFQFVGSDRTWEYWTTGPMGSMGNYKHTAQVPKMPGSRTDLFARGSTVLVDAVQVQASLNDLAKATGIGLRAVGRVATAFNRTELR